VLAADAVRRERNRSNRAKTQLTSGSFARQLLRVIFARSPRQIIGAAFARFERSSYKTVWHRPRLDCE